MGKEAVDRGTEVFHSFVFYYYFLFLTDVETMTGRSVCDLMSAINCLLDCYKIRPKMFLQNFLSMPDFSENRLMLY